MRRPGGRRGGRVRHPPRSANEAHGRGGTVLVSANGTTVHDRGGQLEVKLRLVFDGAEHLAELLAGRAYDGAGLDLDRSAKLAARGLRDQTTGAPSRNTQSSRWRAE